MLDAVLTVFNIIENGKVQRTPSAAKEIQDKIVTELAYEYWGIKKLSRIFLFREG